MSFKQAELWEAVQRPQEISSETVAQMEEVVERYPYFQLIHTLLAKAKHDQQTPDAYAALGRAAVYAPDRRLLRQVFYDELMVVLPDPPPSGESEDLPETVKAPEPDVLLANPIEEISTETTYELDSEDEEALTATSEERVPDQTTEDGDSDSLRDELAKTLEDLRASKEQATESLASSEEESEIPEDLPVVPRTRQQEIIDRFVAAKPQINRDSATGDKDAPDLSAPSSAFQDDLVTENLAEIMLKQGKTDKAVGLYEKLMLKYPEKKAYFAQKIEQLKNT